MSDIDDVTAKACSKKIAELREQVEFWQKEAAGRRDDMANYTRIVSETIDRLNVEVSKLTKERDDLRSRRCEVCGYLEHEREHTGCLREQLAALAEQNEKLHKALASLEEAARCVQAGEWDRQSINPERMQAKEALSLPDLATPVLNKYRAEYADALEQQLAALAEQNEKLKAERSSVWMVATSVFMMLFATKEDAYQSQSQQGASTYIVPMEVPVFGAQLPDLATPVLNKYRAEGVRKASTLVSLVRNDWASAGDNLSVQAAEYLISALDARAAELEKTNG